MKMCQDLKCSMFMRHVSQNFWEKIPSLMLYGRTFGVHSLVTAQPILITPNKGYGQLLQQGLST